MQEEQMTKIAMITGAGSGAGRAVPGRRLDGGGWRWRAASAGAGETAKSLTGEHLIAPADVGDPAAVKRFSPRSRTSRPPDMLFNWPGWVDREELSFEQWQAIVGST
jgi:NAD(P)-dependent dehydrogenase (short-subunit alcohol dehydrogenase family)